MQKIIISVIATLLISACSYFPGVHKIDIQQGNIVTQPMLDQLRPGMTKSQVRYILGTPLLMDTFDQNRWDYLHTLQKGGKERNQERLSLFFKDGKLSGFNGDFIPSSAIPGS
jgi:outer membrane protein assembly factor BamE